MDSSGEVEHWPQSVKCPLTLDVMVAPVTLVMTGQTYDKHAIEEWLQKNDCCPLTGTILNGNHLFVRNIVLANCIEEWRQIFLDKIRMAIAVEAAPTPEYAGKSTDAVTSLVEMLGICESSAVRLSSRVSSVEAAVDYYFKNRDIFDSHSAFNALAPQWISNCKYRTYTTKNPLPLCLPGTIFFHYETYFSQSGESLGLLALGAGKTLNDLKIVFAELEGFDLQYLSGKVMYFCDNSWHSVEPLRGDCGGNDDDESDDDDNFHYDNEIACFGGPKSRTRASTAEKGWDDEVKSDDCGERRHQRTRGRRITGELDLRGGRDRDNGSDGDDEDDDDDKGHHIPVPSHLRLHWFAGAHVKFVPDRVPCMGCKRRDNWLGYGRDVASLAREAGGPHRLWDYEGSVRYRIGGVIKCGACWARDDLGVMAPDDPVPIPGDYDAAYARWMECSAQFYSEVTLKALDALVQRVSC